MGWNKVVAVPDIPTVLLTRIPRHVQAVRQGGEVWFSTPSMQMIGDSIRVCSTKSTSRPLEVYYTGQKHGSRFVYSGWPEALGKVLREITAFETDIA